MKTCYIIAPFSPEKITTRVVFSKEDLILCADAGYLEALHQKIVPHGIIGDFDSAPIPAESQSFFSNTFIQSFPIEKNETDVHLCYLYGKEKGYEHFVLLGGLGGRMDHSYANIQLLIGAVTRGDHFTIIGKNDEISAFLPGSWEIPSKKGWHFSLFSYSTVSKKIELTGAKYPIRQGELTWG
ncbi:MAG: thiamine diphosphokinase, partial [Clostridiales bacterium]|nr:thiamine diphosphokinase [Clostridiales bacterium]